jgi:hypothetical protein
VLTVAIIGIDAVGLAIGTCIVAPAAPPGAIAVAAAPIPAIVELTACVPVPTAAFPVIADGTPVAGGIPGVVPTCVIVLVGAVGAGAEVVVAPPIVIPPAPIDVVAPGLTPDVVLIIASSNPSNSPFIFLPQDAANPSIFFSPAFIFAIRSTIAGADLFAAMAGPAFANFSTHFACIRGSTYLIAIPLSTIDAIASSRLLSILNEIRPMEKAPISPTSPRAFVAHNKKTTNTLTANVLAATFTLILTRVGKLV